jgi:hypothetical protein
MESGVEDRSPQESAPDETPEDGQRWASVLEKVVQEQQLTDPWYVRLGVSLVWAVGIALAAAIVAALVLGIRSLFSADLRFSLRNLSDHIFWGAALLMIGGMVSPSVAELNRVRTRRKDPQGTRTLDERRTQALERRMRQMYDPWRWRIWGGAALTFGLAILTGLLDRS